MEDFNNNLKCYRYFDFDGCKILEKIDSFLDSPEELKDYPEKLKDYSESLKILCLKFLEEILDIRDKKGEYILGCHNPSYFDVVDRYNELRWVRVQDRDLF